MVPAAAAMRHVLLVGLLAATLGCAPTVGDINARPDRYYQKRVDFRGALTRRQDLDGETLLEIADERGARILVRTTTRPEASPGDWVRVRGILVPEARVGTTVLYDVVTAEQVTRARAPRFRDLM